MSFKILLLLTSLVVIPHFISCIDREHRGQTDFTEIDGKIDSIQEFSWATTKKVFRLIHTIDSIHYFKGDSIFKPKSYDDIKHFQYAATDLEREIYAFASAMISNIEKIPDVLADTTQPYQMKNRGDVHISSHYVRTNIFKLSVKIESFFKKQGVKNPLDLEKFEKEMLDYNITFDDRYYLLKSMHSQLVTAECDYFKDALATLE